MNDITSGMVLVVHVLAILVALGGLVATAAAGPAASRELRVVALVVPADSAAIRRATDCAIGKPVFTTLYASESLPAAGLRRETRLELFHDADAATLWLRVVLAECAASDVVATDGFASTPGAATRAERDCCARHPHWREWPDERVELRMQMWRAWRAEQRASDRRARRAHALRVAGLHGLRRHAAGAHRRGLRRG
jgi:hypothetical protein